MEYIAHRVNTVEELKKIPYEYGVELDLRDDLCGRIYIQHNPFERGEDFEEYLESYHHGTMILNIKSERIEHKVLDMINHSNVKDYFFLDSSFPMINLLSEMGEKNIALRFSEYEGLDTIRNMAGKVKWVWIDTFTKIPVDKTLLEEIKQMGYKTCLVSPELQGRPDDVEKYRNDCIREELHFDAICTKHYNISTWLIK